MPIVVVTAGSADVVVDGHKRVRCLRRLQRDTIGAVVWEMPEVDALIFRQLLHTDATESALEQGWLLRTLHEDHQLALDALARRFDRSVSWVSRRLGLVRALPESVQHHIQDGQLVAHAAMKYLVPLARAKGGAVLDTLNGNADPSAVRALIAGTLLIYNGSIAFAITAMFLGAAAWATFESDVLPRWTGWIAVVGALMCAASAPAMYGGPVNYAASARSMRRENRAPF